MEELRSLLITAIKLGIDRTTVKCEAYGIAVSIYDGDTCDIVLFSEGKYTRYNIRMLGYNSPEMRQPKNIDNNTREINKALAIAARDKLALLLGLNMELEQRPLLRVLCNGYDKYGRVLATVYNNDININLEMAKTNPIYYSS